MWLDTQFCFHNNPDSNPYIIVDQRESQLTIDKRKKWVLVVSEASHFKDRETHERRAIMVCVAWNFFRHVHNNTTVISIALLYLLFIFLIVIYIIRWVQGLNCNYRKEKRVCVLYELDLLLVYNLFYRNLCIMMTYTARVQEHIRKTKMYKYRHVFKYSFYASFIFILMVLFRN